MKITTPQPLKLETAKILFMVDFTPAISRLLKKRNLINRNNQLISDIISTKVYIKLGNYSSLIIAFKL